MSLIPTGEEPSNDRPVLNRPFAILLILWASPYSILGATLGVLGLLTGGRVQRRGRVFEFYGGAVSIFIKKCLPNGQFVLALTLGHTILGQSAASLDVAREHEMVHVRQFEKWGPFMGPLYIASTIHQWLIGNRPYRDNIFEREAYDNDQLR